MNILVTGSKGQLGSEIQVLTKSQSYSDYNFLFTDVGELDITNYQEISNCIKRNKINLVVNCAAYTAVEKAEEEMELSKQINTEGVKNLAISCKEANANLIHISTDSVFDGNKSSPYLEDDLTNPLSVYGITKRDGEKEILKHLEKAVIVRTSWVYSTFGHNFVKTILRLTSERGSINVIYDQVGTPTYAKDLAKTLLDMIEFFQIHGFVKKNEIFHYSNEGVCSWYDFAKAILELSKNDCFINPIEGKDFPSKVKRPHFSVLNKSKIKNYFEITIPHWKDSLKDFFEEMEE